MNYNEIEIKNQKLSLGLTKKQLIIYFVAFVLPILAIILCPCWNEAHGVNHCLIDCKTLKAFADLIYMDYILIIFVI